MIVKSGTGLQISFFPKDFLLNLIQNTEGAEAGHRVYSPMRSVWWNNLVKLSDEGSRKQKTDMVCIRHRSLN